MTHAMVIILCIETFVFLLYCRSYRCFSTLAYALKRGKNVTIRSPVLIIYIEVGVRRVRNPNKF